MKSKMTQEQILKAKIKELESEVENYRGFNEKNRQERYDYKHANDKLFQTNIELNHLLAQARNRIEALLSAIVLFQQRDMEFQKKFFKYEGEKQRQTIKMQFKHNEETNTWEILKEDKVAIAK